MVDLETYLFSSINKPSSLNRSFIDSVVMKLASVPSCLR